MRIYLETPLTSPTLILMERVAPGTTLQGVVLEKRSRDLLFGQT